MLNCACTFSQHELDFFYFDFSGRVSVVEVKSKNPKRRVGTRAEIPERKHEFFEINLSTLVGVENWKYLEKKMKFNRRHAHMCNEGHQQKAIHAAL